MSDRVVEWEGKYLRIVREGRWEYVERCGGVHAVVIIAEHDGKMILVEQVRVRRAQHAAQLASYEASAAKYYPDPSALSEDEVGPYLVLRGGLRTEAGALEWCDEILKTLSTSSRDG